MITKAERWEIFIDFAAIVHEHLTDMQEELATASLTHPASPGTVEQLLASWGKIHNAFDKFMEVGDQIKRNPNLTPEQAVMFENWTAKIHEAARETNASLRVFFQKSDLSHLLPSRKASGEDLWPH